MALSDYDFHYNGLDIGNAYPVGLIEAEGLTDLTVGMGDSSIPRGSGDVPGLSVAKARTVTLTLRVRGDKRSQELADDVKTVVSAFAMSQEPKALTFKEPGVPEQLVYVRVAGVHVPRKPTLTLGYRPVTVRLKAADPRVYSAEEYSDTAGIYNPSGGGIDYNKDGNIDYLGDPSAGEVIARNDGNAEAFPVVRFYGPTTGTMTGATIQNITTGAVADFDFASGLLSSDIFTADFRRLVTVDPGEVPYIRLNSSNRYGEWQLPRTPFSLAPGDNVLRLEVDGTTTDAQAVITWRDTSL